MGSQVGGIVRHANDRDMKSIEQWLLEAERAGVESLRPNWNLTQRVYAEEGDVRVYVEEGSGQPVAYCWGTLNTTDSILDVKPSHRGMGIGRSFVKLLLDESIAQREPLLLFTCAPESSEGFWVRMGFTTQRYDSQIWASRVLNIQNEVPETGVPRDLFVRFMDDAGVYRAAPALAEYALRGAEDEFGKIHLPQTVACFSPLGDSDLHVEISVVLNDKLTLLHKGKCKYDEARELGIEECQNGFRITQIHNESIGGC